jgi:hypothetical protein
VSLERAGDRERLWGLVMLGRAAIRTPGR